MTSNDPEVKPVESKNKLKANGNIEINEKYLDDIIYYNTL